MKKGSSITALFLDIGGVLLTDGWDHHARKRAAAHFKLELAEMEDRHHLTFDTYEEGKLTLEEYLARVVFYQKRPFTRAQFRRFMFAQSKPYPRDDRVGPQAQGKVRIEDRRGQQRSAGIELLIGFASSSWTGLWMLLFPPASSTSASPTRTSFGLRWTSPRRRPGRSSISKTPRCSSRSRKVWGFEAFFTRITVHVREAGFVRIAE